MLIVGFCHRSVQMPKEYPCSPQNASRPVLRLPLPTRSRRFVVEMKLALAQIDTTVGDLRGNCGRILEFYRRAAGADLVVTPEMAITGYPPRDLLSKHRFVDDNLRALDELAKQIGPVALLVGYVDKNPKRP